MKTIITTAACLLTLVATAQFNGNKLTQYHGQFEVVLYDFPANGSQFLDEIYKKGTITIENPDSTLEEERLMRFNAFTGQMVYLGQNGEEQSLLKRENITVELDRLTFEVHPYREGAEIGRGYFIPMNPEQQVVLYRRPIKHYRKPEVAEHGYEDTRMPAYFDASEYFIRKGDAPMEPVSLRKNSLLSALGDHRDALRDFVSENNLNLRKPEDALHLVVYYNTLLAPAPESTFASR